MMKRIEISALILGLTVCFFAGKAASHPIVKQINLEEMTSIARIIFSGVCVDVASMCDDETGRDVVFFKFKVLKMIKGEQLDELTVKMSKVALDIGGAPTFELGEEVVLFLYGKSDYGFTSPVGLGQGKFQVKHSAAGEKTVVNGRNNLDLFKDVNKAKYMQKFAASNVSAEIDRVIIQPSGPINYQTFLTLVEGMVAEKP